MSALRERYSNLTKPVEFPRSTPATLFLTSDGLSSGSVSLAVNGSVTPVDFWISSPIPKSILKIQGLSVLVSDAGNPASTDYGNIAGGLINGLQLFFETNGFKIPVETPLKQNLDLMARSQSFEVVQFAGSVRVIIFRDLLSFYSGGFQVNTRLNEKFGVTVNDNLSGLAVHRMAIKGEYYLSDAS